jgi:hypothetical protein
MNIDERDLRIVSAALQLAMMMLEEEIKLAEGNEDQTVRQRRQSAERLILQFKEVIDRVRKRQSSRAP